MTARVISLLARKAAAEEAEKDWAAQPHYPGDVVTPHGPGVWLHMPSETTEAEVEATRPDADEHGPAAAAGGQR